MARLFLKCKGCEKEFFSGMDVPLQGTTFTNNQHQCPHCKKAFAYNTPDYHEASTN